LDDWGRNSFLVDIHGHGSILQFYWSSSRGDRWRRYIQGHSEIVYLWWWCVTKVLLGSWL
jgi:hypothetical protein